MIRIGGRGYGTEGTLYQDENAIKILQRQKTTASKSVFTSSPKQLIPMRLLRRQTM